MSVSRVTEPPSPPTTEAPTGRGILLVAGAAFLLLGAVVALYGPMFPLLRERYGVGLDEVGAVVSAHFLGSFFTVITSGVLLRRFGYRAVLLGGAGLLLAGLTALGLAPGWTLLVLAAGVVGLGFGALQVAVNLLVARSFPAGAASALNLVNAVFGVGALSVPLMVSAFAPRLAPSALVLAALALVVLVALSRFPRFPTPPPRVAAEPGGGARALTLGFVAFYFFYVSTEVGITSWATEHLTPTWGTAVGAMSTSVYWGALTVGRLIAVVVARRVPPGRMLLGGLAIAALGLVAASWVTVAPFAYALVGLVLAPTFGTGLAWLTTLLPGRAEQVTPLVLAAASLGPVATAPLIGAAVAGWGVGALPLTLAALTLLALTCVSWLGRSRPAAGLSSATT